MARPFRANSKLSPCDNPSEGPCKGRPFGSSLIESRHALPGGGRRLFLPLNLVAREINFAEVHLAETNLARGSGCDHLRLTHVREALFQPEALP